MNTTSHDGSIAALALAVPLGLRPVAARQLAPRPQPGSPAASAPSRHDARASTVRRMTSSAPHGRRRRRSAPAAPPCRPGGNGSFNGMATDPVATAASNNPLLSTLVTAVTRPACRHPELGQDITVFAPTNDAFAKIPTSHAEGRAWPTKGR